MATLLKDQLLVIQPCQGSRDKSGWSLIGYLAKSHDDNACRETTLPNLTAQVSAPYKDYLWRDLQGSSTHIAATG